MHTIDYLFSLQSKVRRATTPTERAFALGTLAFTEMRMGKTEEAEQKLADISSLGKNPENAEIEALHLYLVGVFDFYFGRTTKSVTNLLSARQLARLAGSARVEARALAALCSSLGNLGAHSDAFEAADQALEIAEAVGMTVPLRLHAFRWLIFILIVMTPLQRSHKLKLCNLCWCV